MKKVIFQTMPEQAYALMHDFDSSVDPAVSCLFYGLPSEITLQNYLISKDVSGESINTGMEYYRKVLTGEERLDYFCVDKDDWKGVFFLKPFDLIKNPDMGSGK